MVKQRFSLHFWLILLCIALLSGIVPNRTLWAQTLESSEISDPEALHTESEAAEFEKYQEMLFSLFGTQKQYIEHRLQDLKKELSGNMRLFKGTNSTIQELEEKLKPIQEEILSLKGQIDRINADLFLTKIKISHAERQLSKKEDEIITLLSEIEKESLILKDLRQKLKEYALFMYQEERDYLSTETQEKSVLKLLLADNSFGENSLKISYLHSIAEHMEKLMYGYEKTKQDLLAKELHLEKNKKEMANLSFLLEKERENLKSQSQAKLSLMVATKGEEEKYQKLLTQTKADQGQLATDIEKIQSNISLFQQKLKIYQEKTANVEQLTKTDIPIVKEILEKEYDNFFEQSDSAPLRWPLNPKKGISAYFHDESYPFKTQIGEHNAIDIPAVSGTPIHAPRAAVVGKVKAPKDEAYAYVLLIHGDNIMTLYGHVSEVFVKEGEMVQEGDIIGLVGGEPGAKGAGWATTGSHLHLEVFKNGKHVNPLEYLPLSLLPENFIPLEFREEEAIEEVEEEKDNL